MKELIIKLRLWTAKKLLEWLESDSAVQKLRVGALLLTTTVIAGALESGTDLDIVPSTEDPFVLMLATTLVLPTLTLLVSSTIKYLARWLAPVALLHGPRRDLTYSKPGSQDGPESV